MKSIMFLSDVSEREYMALKRLRNTFCTRADLTPKDIPMVQFISILRSVAESDSEYQKKILDKALQVKILKVRAESVGRKKVVEDNAKKGVE